MKKSMVLGIAVAAMVLGLAAVASARSSSTDGWMPMIGNSSAEMPAMEDDSSMDEMMPGMMDTMDSDHMSAMVGRMDADHVSMMMPTMAAHHAEMTGMMSGADSGMMGSGRSMGIDHDGHHSP